MTINEVFNNENIVGVMKVKDEFFVHFNLNKAYDIPSQMIPDNITLKGPEPHEGFNYCILSSKDVELDDMIDLIYAIEQYNVDKVMKDELFKQTLRSLEYIFKTANIDKLQELVKNITLKEDNE